MGSATTPNTGGGFIWTSADGMLNLNTLIAPQSGWVLGGATGINDVGQIVGGGLLNGIDHAYLLTPVPEPSTLALAALGTVALLAAGRRFSPA